MEKIIAFSNKTEARDKFTKAVQYSAKLLAWSLLNVNRTYYKRFNELYLLMRDSRKIFRLFKSIQEVKNINDKIKDLLWKKEKIPVMLEIFSRIGYLIYWIFDNLVIMAKLKLIKTEKVDFISYVAHFGWLIGIVWSLLKNLYEILILFGASNNSDNIPDDGKNKYIDDPTHKLHTDDRLKEIMNNMINIIGRLGDLLPAASGVGLPEKILGYQLNDGVIGIGGLISAVLAMWELWNKF
jgi:peroxin-11B